MTIEKEVLSTSTIITAPRYWQPFINLARAQGTTASALIRRFVRTTVIKAEREAAKQAALAAPRSTRKR
jgi:hypothetical protein